MTEAPYSNFQIEIYMAGVAGQRPTLPFTYDELERRARDELDPPAYAYVAGGASSEETVSENRAAFRRWRIVPRMLRDTSTRDLSTTVLGTRLPAPIMLAPVGVQGIVHADAELATARAAASLGIPMILSTAASRSIEQVAEASGDGPRWFQLYWPRDPELAASFLRRAEGAGYSAIVVTLDSWLLGWRPRDLQGAYLPFLQAEGIANYTSDPVFRSRLATSPEDDPQAAVLHWATVFSEPAMTWERLPFLREHTKLPILLKGILHADDARRAADAGMDGLIVSNHGGRQVDGAIASLDALPAVVEAAADRIPVLFDGGIRTGSDIVKALALRARAVLIGRPYMWGLALAGEDGVRHVVRSLLADFDLAMALSGYSKPGELSPAVLAPSSPPDERRS